MTWQLSDEQLMIRETIREAAQDKIAPRSREVDEKAEFPHDYVDLLRELGLFGIPFKPEYGGVSGSALTPSNCARCTIRSRWSAKKRKGCGGRSIAPNCGAKENTGNPTIIRQPG